MAKLNCWEVKKCGREPGGEKIHEMGVCPSATHARANGIHGGKNGGRVCWAIAGTFCGGKVQGIFSDKIQNCINCEFYKAVRKEEGTSFLMIKKVLELLK